MIAKLPSFAEIWVHMLVHIVENDSSYTTMEDKSAGSLLWEFELEERFRVRHRQQPGFLHLVQLLLAGLGLAHQVGERSARSDELFRVLNLCLLLLVQLDLGHGGQRSEGEKLKLKKTGKEKARF